MYYYFQPNSKDHNNEIGDCVIRAICKVSGKSWKEIFDALCTIARTRQSLPNYSDVFSQYLESFGYKHKIVKKKLTVKYASLLSKSNKRLVMRCEGHLVAAVDGDYYDTWDSGKKIVKEIWIYDNK